MKRNKHLPELARLQPVSSSPVEKQICCPNCRYKTQIRIRREYTPISKDFEPFYLDALEGDLGALIEYFKKSWGAPDLGSAFYQCLGYLAAKGLREHIRIVEAVLRIHKTGGTWNKIQAKFAIQQNWEKTFLTPCGDRQPRAHEIHQWIKKKRANLITEGKTIKRDDLWRNYVAAELPHLAREGGNDPYHKGLEELFWSLAKSTKPIVGPLQAARRAACKIAGISESQVRRMCLRKK